MFRKAKLEDIPEIVNIHISALPNGFLSLLGKNYLKDYFYPSILKSNFCEVLVSESKKIITGFEILAFSGTSLAKEVSSGTKKMIIFLTLMKASFKHPFVLAEFLYILIAKINLVKDLKFFPKENLKNCPEIYLIAVDLKQQNRGIGSMLLKAGGHVMREKGFKYCVVKTDSNSALSFYLKNGYEIVGKERRYKRQLKILYKAL